MRGQGFHFYALVALAGAAFAAPLFVQSDDVLEIRTPHVVNGKGLVVKEGIVNVLKEFVHNRRNENEEAIVVRAG